MYRRDSLAYQEDGPNHFLVKKAAYSPESQTQAEKMVCRPWLEGKGVVGVPKPPPVAKMEATTPVSETEAAVPEPPSMPEIEMKGI